MPVAVISKTGERLMPTSEHRARKNQVKQSSIVTIRLPYNLPKGRLEISSQ